MSYLYSAKYEYQESVDEDEGKGDVTEAYPFTSSSNDLQALAQPGRSHEASRGVKDGRLREVVNNALVYGLAEKYDVQTLKGLAKGNFPIYSEGKWDDESLCTVLEVAYETTPTTDRGLREVISKICTRQLDEPCGMSAPSSRLMSLPRFQEIIG